MRIPVATYRLQINDDFTLHDARAVVPYLAHLGISDLYLSPVFEARRGSTHGYDITDPTRIRESVGGEQALLLLAEEVRRHDMGILLDIVPNHMAATVENPWWRDVLAHGRESRYAHFFDIDWGTPARPQRLRLPILGDELERIIALGEIRIDVDAGELAYHETRLPLAPGSWTPGATNDVRHILAQQHYEPAFWRTASQEMSYRRFFDITDLIGVRVEDPAVFEVTHALIRSLASEGVITGLRIDHIDGLRDPTAYLDTLRSFVRGPDGEPLYTVVEKILERHERVPREWQCEGTTGYEFLNLATGLLIRPDGHTRVEAFYRRSTGEGRAFDELVREKKLLVIERLFGGELTALASTLARLTNRPLEETRRAVAEVTVSMSVYRTYTRSRAIRPEDRKRIEHAVADATRRHPELAPAIVLVRSAALLEGALADNPATLDWLMRWQQFSGPVMAKGFEDTALYCYNALLAANEVGSDPLRPCLTSEELHSVLEQRRGTLPLSLNATATHDTKRGEDTRARIAVLTEIPDEWRERLRRWSRAGEDWKAEAPGEDAEVPSSDVESLLYQTLLGAWPLDTVDQRFMDRIQMYMTKAVREAKEQTSWRRPDEDYEQALTAFIKHLMAEFGRTGLAENIAEFADRIAPHGALNSLAQLLLKVTAPGIPDFYQGTELWSLTLVDPDNRMPVDYADRRSVLEQISPLRDNPRPEPLRPLLETWRDGRIKMLLTAHALRFRAMHRELFEDGALAQLSTDGRRREHVIAFARTLRERACITVLPRWTTGLADGTTMDIGREVWEDTRLTFPEPLRRRWHNALTGESFDAAPALELAALFHALPFALLEESQPIGA